MGTDRPFEQARNIWRVPTPEDDQREPWVGPEPQKKAKANDASDLLRGYLAVHGDWREVTHIQSDGRSTQKWEFQICQCPLCAEAEKIVGHPSTPSG